MEQRWVANKKQLKLKQTKEKVKKGYKKNRHIIILQFKYYVQKRLKLCKNWAGPVVSVEELHSILKYHRVQNEVIVCNELVYFRESH